MMRCNYCFEKLLDSTFEVCAHCGYVQGDGAKELYHLYPGTMLYNRYIVGQVLGFGGFGITYMTWDTNLDTVMAIKEYYPSGLVNRIPGTKDVNVFSGNRLKAYTHGLTRFLDEARSMAKFSSHKNIINIFEYFEENNTAYIVMEYLDGTTLSDFLKTNRMDFESGIEIILHICSALKDIHKMGIIHRDISPDNIFLCSGGIIKLIDFGAARFSSDEAERRTIILKPGFAPPEQYEKVNIQGAWTDIYALGATLYYIITGVKPEESTNRKVADDLAAPKEIDPEIPEHISNTIMKAMAIDKHLRFISVADFEKALSGDKKVLPVTKERRRRKLRRLITVLASAVIIAISSYVFITNWNRQKEAETLPDAVITLWYFLSGDIDADAAKNTAYAAIVSAFTDSFPNVTIKIESHFKEDYDNAIRAAVSDGNMPALFETTNISRDLLNDIAIDLSGVVADARSEHHHFLDRYASLFPQKNQLPLGFIAPAFYVNKTLLTLEENGLSGIGMTAQTGDAKAQFLSGNAELYFADTADYFDVRSALPARYRLLYVDDDTILASFTDLWSIGMVSQDEKRVAERFLLFMLSDNAQDYLYIRNRNKGLPVNKSVLDVFSSVYSDFDGFFVNIENYHFLPQD